MNYIFVLYRTETKEKHLLAEHAEDFFTDTEKHDVFTDVQKEYLLRKMKKFKYDITSSEDKTIHLKHRDKGFGTAILYPEKVVFQLIWNMNAIFEVGLFVSELTDTEEFAKYNPQEGEWEEEDLTNI